MDASGSGYGPVASSREHGNELSGSVKCGHFLDWLNGYQIFKDCTPWSYLFI
jgi:hypothetical protein